MIAKIALGSNLYGALAYSQDKIDRGKGLILETNRVFVPTDGQFSVGECMRDFERTMPPQVTTTRGIVHISLNPHPEDKLSNEQLTDIGREYIERMGFGGQPWMLFKHEDIDREHLHIVTTRVRGDGTLISDKNNFEKSRKITDDLERKYGLHPKGERLGKEWQLAPVDATAGELKKQVAGVVKSLAETYRFSSLPGYRALMSLYNVGVEKVEGDNKGHRYTGLVYSALDADGNRVGKPLKSSLFGKQYGIEALEQTMAISGEAFKADGIRATVAASLADSDTGGEFRAQLREKGIDLVLRYGNGGRLFGATFIDHNTRTVLNGSALGKEFSANAILARFADFSQPQEHCENRRSVSPALPHIDRQQTAQSAHDEQLFTPTRESQRSIIQPDSGDNQSEPVRESQSPAIQPAAPVLPRENHPVIQSVHDQEQPQPVKNNSGDDLSADSLFSILTPEPGQHDENHPIPKPRKKKKRKYGRQM